MVTNGRERYRSQVSGGRSERVPRTRSLLGYVLVCSDRFGVRWVRVPFMGHPAFPFIGQGKAWVIVEGKEENEKEKKSSRIAGSFFFFMRVPPTM